MRELNEIELKAVSGGATVTEYAILLNKPVVVDVTTEVTVNNVLKTKHDTAKNAIGNIR